MKYHFNRSKNNLVKAPHFHIKYADLRSDIFPKKKKYAMAPLQF